MLNRAQPVRRNAQFHALAKAFGHQGYVLQVRQKRALGLVVGVADIVTDHAALASEFANTRHCSKILNALGQMALVWKARAPNEIRMKGQATSPFSAFMRRALDLAQAAATSGEVPVGAVIVRNGVIIATGTNAMRTTNDPTAHAEITAIRSATATLGNQRLHDCDLWVTLEPCAMCAGAISHARLARLYYAAADPKGGGVAHGARVFSHPTCHHTPEVYAGIGEEQAAAQLRDFFAMRREAQHEG